MPSSSLRVSPPAKGRASLSPAERRTRDAVLVARRKEMIRLRAQEQRDAAKAESDQAAIGLAESIQLARRRGETVEVPARGRVVVKSRDVLAWMFARGFLGAAQFRAGRAYQRLFERCDPERGLTPAPLALALPPNREG